ncbi:MAG: hypothetical protein H7195_11905 [Chryseobacterium sp.]|nr:hypothetical protein [Chryseobacterium sp.]
MTAQEHFSGITTSKRVGILSGGINPSEFANLSSKIEINLFASSFNISNNKVGFKDIIAGNDVENLIFAGNEPVNFSIDAEFAGPSVAIKALGWGFGISTKSFIKANIIDVDPNLGNALSNNAVNSILTPTIISNNYNQRLNSTAWGEVGFSIARKIFSNKLHQLNGGVTLKLLFPGAYSNIGLGSFGGTITNQPGGIFLSDANASLNIAYSGSLAGNYNNTSDYTNNLFGKLNGMATDIGFDYQFLPDGKSYRLKVGAAIKNMGSMTFKGDDNYATDYTLKIPAATPLNPGFNLNNLDNAVSIKDIEKILLESTYLKGTPKENDFKVKLPTVLNLYADVKVISKLNVTLFLQKRMNDKNANDQISSQNSLSITPRINLGFFEAYIPVGFNEISGTTGGFGFRLGGFFMGSNSIITALASDSKQADVYFGTRFGFL